MTGAESPASATPVLALASMHCRRGAPRLAADELASHLRVLTGWTPGDGRITKEFRCDDYHATIALVNAIAWIAHREDHHPDLAVQYDRCRVTYSTHDAGGVTINDVICAAKVERLFA